jgi:hypothetical protein
VEKSSYWKMTFPSASIKRDTYEDGVSLVVVEEPDELDSTVIVDPVTVVAELNASYLVVGDVNT